ncbi:MAG: hypothetical protein KJ847_02475 [Firmicutes bacterium]|nr:hypothetical protein [Bacillota bacterium]
MPDFRIDCTVWGMSEGNITCVKFGDSIFSIQKGDLSFGAPIPSPLSLEKHRRKSKPFRRKLGSSNVPVLVSWLRDNNIKCFTVEQFFRANPRYTGHLNIVNHYIGRLISDKKIVQTKSDKDNPYNDSFKVVGDV